MLAQFVIAFLYAIVFTAIIYRWRFFHLDGIKRKWVVGAFILKLIAGVALWWVYSYHYKGAEESDALRYYNDAIIIKQQWTENREVFWSLMLGEENESQQYQMVYNKLVGWYSGYRYGLTNDCRTIIRLNVIISFVSFGSHHVHWMFMAFMAFMGLTALFKAFQFVFLKKIKLLFVACFLLPSVVFWSAGLLKEGPTLLGLGFLFLGISRWMHDHKKWMSYVMMLCSVALLVIVKEYVLFSMLPAIFFLIVLKFSGKKWILIKFVATQLVCFIVAQNAHHFFIGGDFLYVLNKKRVDFENTSLIHNAKSTVLISESGSISEFVIHYPEAFALSYLRPFPWEVKSWMYALFAAENLIYALLISITIFFFKKPDPESWPMLLAALSFVLILAAIIGNCVPVLGSIVRYRVPGLPLLVLFCLACMNIEKLKRISPFS